MSILIPIYKCLNFNFIKWTELCPSSRQLLVFKMPRSGSQSLSSPCFDDSLPSVSLDGGQSLMVKRAIASASLKKF